MNNSRPNKRRWKAAALLVVAVAAGSLLLTRCRGPVVAVVQVNQQPLEQRVVATGRVSTLSQVQVGSEIAGVVLERRVSENDPVQPGQVLLVLRADDLQANLDQAQAALATLQQSRRPQAQASHRLALAEQEQAQREYQRRRSLGERELIAREAVEQARQAWLAAQAQAEQTASSLRAVADGGAEEAQELARVAAAQAAVDKTLIRATVAGKVIGRAVEPGDTVQPGSVLLEIASDGPTELRVPVNEQNLGVLALGQPATAIADAWPQRPFPATVSWLSPAVDSSRGSIEVRLQVDPVPDFLRQNLTVSVNILSARKPDALVIPNTALRSLPGNRHAVWQVAQGKLTQTLVTLGLRGSRHSEVTSGLAAGQQVLVNPDATLQAGQRVRSHVLATASDDLDDGKDPSAHVD